MRSNIDDWTDEEPWKTYILVDGGVLLGNGSTSIVHASTRANNKRSLERLNNLLGICELAPTIRMQLPNGWHESTCSARTRGFVVSFQRV